MHMQFLVQALLCLLIVLPCLATDLTQGVMLAVPTPNGKAPVIDGTLDEWDLSAAEPVWMSPETASRFHAQLAAMYDEHALYLSTQVHLGAGTLKNPNTELDPFWQGDCLQFRLVADPAVPFPAPRKPGLARAAHISLWKNTQTGQDLMHIAYGATFDQGSAVNPPGAQLVIRTRPGGYVAEVRLPWSVLRSPDGKNPFKPGDRMTFIAEVLRDSVTMRVAAVYHESPDVFAFAHPERWGQLEFSPHGHVAPRHATMDEVLAKQQERPTVGVPITVNLPKPMKLSVNIVGPHGEVIRELTGGEARPAGSTTLYWDGRDQWGAPVPPGIYRWGAYLSPGLTAEYMGSVGISGDVPYETEDGRGGWGGDHADPVDAAADASGQYFLWVSAEQARAVVKLDYQGKVCWRKTPFVGGGFGPYLAIAAYGKYAFVVFGIEKPQLIRLDAATGQLAPFANGAMTPIADSAAVPVPAESRPLPYQPETTGLACTATVVYASVYSQNLIRVLDAETGKVLRDIACPGPRGLALDRAGNLYAVSYRTGTPGQVVRFTGGMGTPQPIVSEGLVAPWDVTVDADGRLYVTDGGASQQVKIYAPTGKLLKTLGTPGGRAWAGRYQRTSYRNPAGIAADMQGGVLLAEASGPKPISRFAAGSGKLLRQWFGFPAYAPTNIPDPEDPWTNYYSLASTAEKGEAGCFARARIPGKGRNGDPTAFWHLPNAGYPFAGAVLDTMTVPDLSVAANGKRYLVSDMDPHAICLVEGDRITPVGFARVVTARQGGPALELWSDANFDHQPQPEEVTRLTTVDGQPIGELVHTTGSCWMAPDGTLYLTTQTNRILKMPACGFDRHGVVQWDAGAASFAVPCVLPNAGNTLFTTYREGLLGVRTDTAGNLYTCLNANVPYATPALTRAMKDGLGHAALFNAVKFAKFSPDGRLLWMAGRKATQACKPGEMYHFWVLGGLVNDRYVAGCSEWGQIYLYTHDGFFVDALMNDPGLGSPAGPYTFGGETFAGRVQYYPRRDEVWAYSCGFAYRVRGFARGMVQDEQRLWGQVTLDRTYDTEEQVAAATPPVQIVPLANPWDAATAWEVAPRSVLRRNGQELATVQVSYDAQYLYVRAHVTDDTPLRNSADILSTAFKGGDAVGISLGPSPRHDTPGAGDIRLLAAQINGAARLIAMKPVTAGEKRPERYFTPAGGDVRFDFVGEVPNGRVRLTPDADGHGYTALFAVPRAFLEVTLAAGTNLSAEVEVLLSGQGARGVQTMSRNALFSPRTSQTTMVDDIPTEARLYPRYWGTAEVR